MPRALAARKSHHCSPPIEHGIDPIFRGPVSNGGASFWGQPRGRFEPELSDTALYKNVDYTFQKTSLICRDTKPTLMPDPFTFLIVLAAVFVIAFMKGAFGGGFAIVGIPLLALVMAPIEAGALLAPLFVAMDLFALRYWSPSTWSKRDLKILLPALVVGIGIGTWLLGVLDGRAIAILIGSVTLLFAGKWYAGGRKVAQRERSGTGAAIAGTASGVTTMVAHSGGPPLAMYLLPLGLPKNIYAGTTSLFFTSGNIIKLFPWIWLGSISGAPWLLMLIVLPIVPLGVWAGWRLHERLDQILLYRVLYALLVLVALKLIWDGVGGYIDV